VSRLPSARCARCRQRKPLSEFYRRRSGRPLSYCKACQRRAVRAAEQRRRQDPSALADLWAVDRARQQRWRRLRGQGPSPLWGGAA
jgi:recombinational DNA repair protein (RecF pathway)